MSDTQPGIGRVRISKKLATLLTAVLLCEYLRYTGQSIEEFQPYLALAGMYIGGQSVVDLGIALKGGKQ